MGVSLRIHALVPLASLLCCSSLALVTINAVSSSPASSTSSSSSYSSSSESPSIYFKNPLDQDGFTRALKSIKSNRAVEPKKLPRQPHVLSVTEGKSMSSKKWSFPWPGEQRKSLAPSSKTGIRAGISLDEIRDRRSIRKNGRQPGILSSISRQAENWRLKRAKLHQHQQQRGLLASAATSGSSLEEMMSDYPEDLVTLVVLLREALADGTLEDLLLANPWLAQFATPDVMALITSSLDDDDDEDDSDDENDFGRDSQGDVDSAEGVAMNQQNKRDSLMNLKNLDVFPDRTLKSRLFKAKMDDEDYVDYTDENSRISNVGALKRGALAASEIYSALKAFAGSHQDVDEDPETRARLWRTAAQQLGLQGQDGRKQDVYSLANKLEPAFMGINKKHH